MQHMIRRFMRYTFNYIFIKTVNQQIMKHIHTIKSYAAIYTKNVYGIPVRCNAVY